MALSYNAYDTYKKISDSTHPKWSIGKIVNMIMTSRFLCFMSRIQVSVESIFDTVTCKKLCASNIVAVATLFS